MAAARTSIPSPPGSGSTPSGSEVASSWSSTPRPMPGRGSGRRTEGYGCPWGVGGRMAATLPWAGTLVEFMGAGLGAWGCRGSGGGGARPSSPGIAISGATLGAWGALRVRESGAALGDRSGLRPIDGGPPAPLRSDPSMPHHRRPGLAALAMLWLILLGSDGAPPPRPPELGNGRRRGGDGLPWDEDQDWFYWTNHAVQIRAPPERVWPWLAQIGQERGGFYSDEWLVNLFGLRIRSADRIHPEWQDVAPGDLVRAAPPDWLGGSVGATIPKDIPDRLHVRAGDELFVVETREGILLTPYDPEFQRAMAAYERTASRYRNALRELAE